MYEIWGIGKSRLPLLLLSWCIFGLALPLSAQSENTADGIRPEEPEVELQTIVLEYTAIEREVLEFVLPDEDFIALPELEQQLPEAGALRVEGPVREFGTPEEPRSSEPSRADFFSEGRIGAGSDNHLIGDIALYKRGDFPLYQFRFSHEGIDGYGANDPGTGYFDRVEELSGSIELGGGPHRLRSSMEYFEQETGLQDFSGAYSVVHRFLHGDGEYSYSFASPFSIETRVNAHSGSRNLGSQQEEDEQFIETGIALLYGGDTFTADLISKYTFHDAPKADGFHQGLIELRTQYFGRRFEMNGGVGLHFDTDSTFRIPWNFTLRGVAGDRWRFGLEASSFVENILYRRLWKDYPLLDIADRRGLGTGWNYGGSLGFSPWTDVEIGAGLSYEDREDVPLLMDRDTRDASSGLFPFQLERTEAFIVELDLTYSPRTAAALKGGWTGRFQSDEAELDPAHSLYMELSYSGRERGFFMAARGEYTIKPTSVLPLIDLELGYGLSKGITLLLVGSDLAAPFYDGGRPWWGDYEQRGFNVTLQTEISL